MARKKSDTPEVGAPVNENTENTCETNLEPVSLYASSTPAVVPENTVEPTLSDEAIATAAAAAAAAAANAAKAARRAKKTAARAEAKAARETVYKFTQTKEFDDLTEDIKAALKLLAPAPSTNTGSRVGSVLTPIADIFENLFPTVGSGIDELALFKETKWGPSEMRKRVRNALKKAKPENRRWITFDAETERWTLVGTGVEAPADWK